MNLVGVGDYAGASGTLTLSQQNALANMKIVGSITGLPANLELNIHCRRSSDVSSNCANQGDFINPHNVRYCKS